MKRAALGTLQDVASALPLPLLQAVGSLVYSWSAAGVPVAGRKARIYEAVVPHLDLW